jgi:hypothetical protein
MKNFSRRLKKTAPLILLGLIVSHSPVIPSAQALVGGPFDNNEYPSGNADGTYSGTVSGHNLTGIVSFGVSSSQETTGRFSIFHEGFIHYGAATGIADLASRRIAGSLLGVASLGGSGTAGGGVNVGGATTGNPETQATGSSVAATGTSVGTITVRSGIEGSFTARIKGYPQAIKFEGTGRLSSNANTAVVTKATLSPTNGVLDAFKVFFPTNTSAKTQTDDPSEDTNDAATGGNMTVEAQAQRAILRTETSFKIRGSRTSRTPYTSVLTYTAVQTTTNTSTPIPLATPFPDPPGNLPAPTPVAP